MVILRTRLFLSGVILIFFLIWYVISRTISIGIPKEIRMIFEIATIVIFAIAVFSTILIAVKTASFYTSIIRKVMGVAHTLAYYRELRQTLRFVLIVLTDIMNAERATIFLLDEDKKELKSYVALGLEMKEIALPVDKGIAGYVVRTGETVSVLDAYKDKRFEDSIDRMTGFKTRNILCMPLFDHKGEILGAVQILNRRGKRVLKIDEMILKLLSEQIQVAIENTMLYEEREKMFKGLIKSFSAAIDARDPATRGHSERVVAYSLAIGRALNLSQEKLDILEFAASLHDVGKIGIRDSILLKPAEFTPEEYEIVKKHAVYTKEILESIYFPKPQRIIPMIASTHHEKLDGSGYPFGLSEEKLPLLSKILAVADIYDALVSYDRPYKPPFSIDDALKFLKDEAEAGRLDKNIVDTFINRHLYILERRKFIRVDANLTVEYKILVPEELKSITSIIATSQDISASGIRIETPEYIPIGSYLEMKVYIDTHIFSTIGRVVHISSSDKRYSVGICFLGLSDDEKQKLQKYLIDMYPPRGR